MKKNTLKFIIPFLILFPLAVYLIFSPVDTENGPQEEEEFSCGREFIDERDDQVYKTVEIGGDCWMAENLRYDNSEELIYSPEREEWVEAAEEELPAYSVYLNDMENLSQYGYLYNWYGVDLLDLCPEGWSVPLEEDWQNLEKNLFHEENSCNERRLGNFGCFPAGAKIKTSYGEGITEDWNNPVFNCDGGNVYQCSGFDALPSGGRYDSGTYFGLGSRAFFWTATQFEEKSLFRGLRSSSEGMLRNAFSPSIGMSIRCILD